MKLPTVKVGFGGVLGLAAVAAALYAAYKLFGSSGVLANVGSAIGGGVYDALNGDANAAVQSTFHTEMDELKAAGYPPPGSSAYNAIVVKYNPAQVMNPNGGLP